MARMHKVVELDDGLSITVHELTVEQIIELFGDKALSGDGDMDFGNMQGFIDRHLPKATDLSIDKAIKMAPSELKLVYDAFREVNATFFDTARAVGVEAVLAELKKALAEDFSKLLAASLKSDT